MHRVADVYEQNEDAKFILISQSHAEHCNYVICVVVAAAEESFSFIFIAMAVLVRNIETGTVIDVCSLTM